MTILTAIQLNIGQNDYETDQKVMEDTVALIFYTWGRDINERLKPIWASDNKSNFIVIYR